MGKPSTQEIGSVLAREIETMTEDEALRALDNTREIICSKAKVLSQQREAKRESMAGFNDVIGALVEEQETEIIRKSLLEDHLKRLNVVAA